RVAPGDESSLAPVGAEAPSRARYLTREVREALEAGLPSLDASFPWPFLQSAPRELQIPFLAGDEWLLLEGFGAPDVRVRLPWLRARCVLVGAPGRAPGETPLQLALDTLSIDLHTRSASVLFRGVAPLLGDPARARVISRVTSGPEPSLAATA